MSTNEGNITPSNQEDNSGVMTTLPTKMQRFVHLYLTGQYTLNKLSQLLEVHPNTLSNWLKRKDVKEAIAEIQDGVRDQVQVELKTLTLKATQRLAELMDSSIDAVALQAVKDVLDRGGHKQKQEIKIDKTVTTIEQKMKDLIDATIVEGEYEEIE